MRTYLDCIPCFFRQLLSAARIARLSPQIQKKVLDEFAQMLPQISLNYSPPRIAYVAYHTLNKVSGKNDPYKKIRRKSNEIALSYYREMKRKVEKSEDRLLKAVELAILGNVIDFGVRDNIDLKGEVKTVLSKDNFKKPIFHYSDFKRILRNSSRILYLADNAGETVFDRILIEEIKRIYPHKEIFYAVKSGPIINDALLDDACQAGIDKLARVVISNRAPGTILSLCRDKFKKIYKKADLIISKGQGNFESLSNSRKNIFFMFMAKCSVVAKHIGCEISDIVLLYNHNKYKRGGKK
jgi:hypothetical protein